MSKPTKVNQIVTGDTLTTSAPLPATVNPDGRSSNLIGVEGAFLAGGPMMVGRGYVSLPQAVGITFTADQLFGTSITITGAGANAIQLPGAPEIVAFVTSQYGKVPTVAWPNTGTAATPVQYYPAFRFTVTIQGTSQLNCGTRTLYYALGPISAGAADTGALVANSINTYEMLITNITPGAETCKLIKL